MLHGKLTRQEDGMEDLLTSNTFGLMKYFPSETVLTVLIPFLNLAWNPVHIRDNRPLYIQLNKLADLINIR